ncbi:metallophosphoesterase family protein [Verrucomicrobiaceae bacterium N1E253]|uniref:Metallophosphoesterase family protein n=1 Tax=Oceaniferula marina TaxID=2748318 RepID=A0A851GP77_9BACT|nr:metallophosphoesterase family protein [Oceaniferula marina]NWK55944.1 metallophosphoesterase family protein [Oceaniferula marina]
MRSIIILLAATATLVQAKITRTPYLQLANDSSIHIVWRTDNAIQPSIRYGLSAEQLGESSDTVLTRQTKKDNKDASTPPLFDAPKGTFQYEAKVSGLKADTLYHYAVFDGQKRLTPNDGTYTFRTHPKPGSPRDLYFWAVGDSGTGSIYQKKVFQAMLDYNAKHKLTLDMYLHVGDMAYGSGKDPEFQSKFFQIYQPTLRNTVCWPAMGNHEGYTSNGKTGVGPYYDAYVSPTKGEAGGVPSGTEAYYSYDYGRVHFIVLNSHDLDRKPTATMAQWLKEDLAKTSSKKSDWIVAFWHHPPYTKGSHDSDKEKQLIEMREYIMPILESSGVDLVLTGHSHIYERSMLIDGAYDTPTTAENHVLDDGDGHHQGDGSYQKSPGLKPNEGTIQIVTGHGGQGLRRKGYSPIMKRSILEHGSTLVWVKGDTLSAIMLDKTGKVADEFQIEKKQAVTPTRIAKPWSPTDLTAGTYLIPKNASWSYLSEGHPAAEWAKPGFNTSTWKTGRAGFGYGDNDDTTITNIQGKQNCIYIRKNFTLKKAADAKKLWLSINYDDGFILYLNGKEAFRQNVKKGRGKEAKGVAHHDAVKFDQFDLSPFASLLKEGNNTIAIEGHNRNLNSSDLSLHPTLILKTK